MSHYDQKTYCSCRGERLCENTSALIRARVTTDLLGFPRVFTQSGKERVSPRNGSPGAKHGVPASAGQIILTQERTRPCRQLEPTKARPAEAPSDKLKLELQTRTTDLLGFPSVFTQPGNERVTHLFLAATVAALTVQRTPENNNFRVSSRRLLQFIGFAAVRPLPQSLFDRKPAIDLF